MINWKEYGKTWEWCNRGTIPVRGEVFRIRPDRPRGPPNVLYNGCRISSPRVKRPGRGVNHPHLCSAEVKERVEPYLYSLCGPSWPVLGQTLPNRGTRPQLACVKNLRILDDIVKIPTRRLENVALMSLDSVKSIARKMSKKT